MDIQFELTPFHPIGVQFSIPVFSKFMSLFSPQTEITFSIKGADYYNYAAPFSKEVKGRSGSIVIRGSSAFCLAVLSYLSQLAEDEEYNLHTHLNDPTSFISTSSIAIQPLGSQMLDLFAKTNTITWEWTSENFYRKTKVFGLWSEEGGAKIDVSIRGKQRFVIVGLSRLQDNPALLRKVLSLIVTPIN